MKVRVTESVCNRVVVYEVIFLTVAVYRLPKASSRNFEALLSSVSLRLCFVLCRRLTTNSSAFIDLDVHRSMSKKVNVLADRLVPRCDDYIDVR